MTSKQAATLVSRAFCLWFAYSAITRLSVIPSLFYSMRAISIMNSGIGSGSVVTGRYHSYTPGPLTLMGGNLFGLIGLITLILDITLAIIFYRCGPRAIRFFLGKESEPAEPENI